MLGQGWTWLCWYEAKAGTRPRLIGGCGVPFLCVTPSVEAREALQGPVKDRLMSQGQVLGEGSTVRMCRGGQCPAAGSGAHCWS